MFYSKSTGGFYAEEIHGARQIEQVDTDTGETRDRYMVDNPACRIPVDAVEITEAEHAALLEGQAQGKEIRPGANGRPELRDPPAGPPPTVGERRRAAYAEAGVTVEAMVVALWEARVENRPAELNRLQALREQIKQDIPKP